MAFLCKFGVAIHYVMIISKIVAFLSCLKNSWKILKTLNVCKS